MNFKGKKKLKYKLLHRQVDPTQKRSNKPKSKVHSKVPRLMIYLLFGFAVVVVDVDVVAIIGSPFPFGVAVVIAQINATNNKKVFILMGAKTVN